MLARLFGYEPANLAGHPYPAAGERTEPQDPPTDDRLLRARQGRATAVPDRPANTPPTGPLAWGQWRRVRETPTGRAPAMMAGFIDVSERTKEREQ